MILIRLYKAKFSINIEDKGSEDIAIYFQSLKIFIFSTTFCIAPLFHAAKLFSDIKWFSRINSLFLLFAIDLKII
tara:strand:+ start:673 stop:897 length:225 start_codon:yes stop_codon:yes gene_type:complete